MNKINLKNSPVIYRELNGEIDKIKLVNQQYLSTLSGQKLFDFSGGPCVSALGHSNQYVIDKIKDQAGRVPYAYSGFWGTDACEALGEYIKKKFEETWPGWFGKVAFPCSGNEAVEFACRLAYQYHAEKGKDKKKFAVRKYSFHGTSLFTSALTDDYGKYGLMHPYYEDAREDYVVRLPGYAGPEPHEPYEDYEKALLEETALVLKGGNKKKNWQRKDCAAMILEPVGGPPVGGATPSATYLKGLRQLCDEHNMLMIFDEVLCGTGRIGAFTMAQQCDVRPDIILLGKGLTGGYLPLSAVVCSQDVIDRIDKGTGVTMIGTTYLNHPMGCAAGLAALEFMDADKLYSKVRVRGERYKTKLIDEIAHLPFIKAVHGIGYLWGIQLIDPDTGKPFDPDLQMHKRVRQHLYNDGIVTYTKGQTVDGLEDYVMLTPPYDTPMQVLDQEIAHLGESLSTFDWR